MGNESIVKYLCENGASISTANAFGWTPLIAACRNGHYNVVEHLISKGAVVTQPDEEGESAIEHCRDSSIRALLQAALDHGKRVLLKPIRCHLINRIFATSYLELSRC